MEDYFNGFFNSLLRFELISSRDGFNRWNHLNELERLRASYGLVQSLLWLSSGQSLVCAYVGESLAGFVWLTPPGSSHPGYTLSFNQAYYHDAWTFPEFRGGVFSSLIVYLAQTIAETNSATDTLVAHAVKSNKAAVAGQKKAGMTATALEVSIFILGWFRRFRPREAY